MASQYKIPRKKQSESDSAHIHLQSPLSRLQSPAPQLKDYGDQTDGRRADRMHSGNTPGSSTNGHRTPCKPLFSNVVKTLLGLNSPHEGGQSAANRRPLGSSRSQSQQGQRETASSSPSNGWRPKRASDCRLASERLSPPQKKSFDSAAPATKSISVVSVDSLAELRGEGHAGSPSPLTPGARTQRRVETAGNTTTSRDAAAADGTFQNDRRKTLDSPSKLQNNSSEDDFVSPTRTSGPSSGTETDGRRSLAMAAQREDVRERERQRWKEFTERKSNTLRRRKHKQTPAEPIVLSSEEEEEEGEDERGRTKMASQGATSRPEEGSRLRTECSPRAEEGHDQLTLPSYLQLEFSSLHAGLMHADAYGKMMITENGITVPVKVSEGEEGEVTVVASQLRGYGVWDGGVARGGTLLASWESPAPSLLFLWVTDAQANLLQRELSAHGQSSASSGPSCCFLLLVLKEQLQELQAALLASILDMTEYQKGRSSSSSSSSASSSSSFQGPSSPVDWTDGLLLLHSCPPPLDQHLLALLGHSATAGSASSIQGNRKSSLRSSGQQQLPVRLIQYPPPPCKGRISVTREDLARLNAGEFLNDVIIDFYLKFLLLEGVGGSVAERSHVFSSFFYKQLSRRRAAGEDDAPSVPDRHMRHQRVKTWTRHIDIFTKDFLFVPVNQEAHWFLVVVCFPGLEHEESQTCTGASEQVTGKRGPSLRQREPPDCTELGRHSHSVLKRPCVLVMDSLKLSYHENVCKLLRDYLQVEWEVRRRTPRLFTSDTMRSCSCRVPQQDNSSDCGLYLLQYVESFLQNPVVHFELPLRLDNWFPRQQVRQKREEIRSLIIKMHESQTTKKTDQKPK